MYDGNTSRRPPARVNETMMTPATETTEGGGNSLDPLIRHPSGLSGARRATARVGAQR
jgi:hypothetical protein